jgi:hypothetical protein
MALYNRMINEAYKQDLMDRVVINVKAGDIVEDLGGERYTVEKVSKNYFDVEDSDKGKSAKRWMDEAKEQGCNVLELTWVAVVDCEKKKHVYVYGDCGVTKVVDAAFKVQQLEHVKEHTSVMDGYFAIVNEDRAEVVIGQENNAAKAADENEKEEDEKTETDSAEHEEGETTEEEKAEHAEGELDERKSAADEDEEEEEEEEEDDEEEEEEEDDEDETEDDNEIAATDEDGEPMYPVTDDVVKESVKDVTKKVKNKIDPVKAKGKSLKVGKFELKSQGFEKPGKAGKKAKKSKKAKSKK